MTDTPSSDGPNFGSAAPPPIPDPSPNFGSAAPPPIPDPGPGFGSAAPPPMPDPVAEPVETDVGSGIASAAESRAQKNVTEDSRTYPCEACGGELFFDIPTQLLKCQHCGITHELVEGVSGVHERDLHEALALVRAGRAEHTANIVDGAKEIVCQNCGGHSTFTGSLTADKCPYCATPIQRDDVQDAPERLPVDAVLPFSVDAKSAEGLIDKWINGRWFAPSEFKTYNRTGSFQSVYMAYFTYDADTFTNYTGQRGITRTRTVGSGDNRRTETYTEWYSVRGSVRDDFDDVTVLANTGFEKKRIDKLEPWPTHEAKSYSAEYVAGHLARTYDNDVEVCLEEATAVMQNEIRSTIRRDIGGDQQRISSMDVNWRNMTYKHLLLPLWLLTVIYAERPFQVYINGVTGEVHGARPYSKVKIMTAIAVVLLVVIAIAIAVSASKSGAG